MCVLCLMFRIFGYTVKHKHITIYHAWALGGLRVGPEQGVAPPDLAMARLAHADPVSSSIIIIITINMISVIIIIIMIIIMSIIISSSSSST